METAQNTELTAAQAKERAEKFHATRKEANKQELEKIKGEILAKIKEAARWGNFNCLFSVSGFTSKYYKTILCDISQWLKTLGYRETSEDSHYLYIWWNR